MRTLLLLSFFAVATAGCQTRGSGALLTRLPAAETGVTFVNNLIEGEGLNVLEYEYYYNGGGVAAGDISGDGLPDLYFTSNMGPNALYLNDGELRFRDITGEAGVGGETGWTTGVTMADVNGDGRLDIYVCKSGRVSEALRRNELYINNGDLTFTESAAAYGLDDPSYSTHASFFDYDADGDLDMFLVNHAIERYSRFDVEAMKGMRDPLAGDKLYRNEEGRFVDVTMESGIHGNPIGFGLSASVSDVNGDGRPDIFVANDYIEDDYLYINNGDGTFTEQLRRRLAHTSYSSMGTDIADVDNDGRADIITLDMMPEDPVRKKRLQGPNDYERYNAMLAEGYYRQLMRNMLQLNNGNGTFSEIGQLAGISETDWSWAPLLADLDNDGFKDLYVTNGYLRDYTDMDFLMSVLQDSLRRARASGRPIDADAIVRQMPQTPISNYAFQNTNGLQFEDRTHAWGAEHPSFSNGAAYADLDLDGDLDLVVNNINDEAFVYRNNTDRQSSHRFLRLQLEGDSGNRFGVGSRVEVVTSDGRRFVQEMHPSRGYLSSVEPVLHFGVATHDTVDVQVTWPDGRTSRLADVPTNRSMTARYADAGPAEAPPASTSSPYFVDVPDRLGLDFVHLENNFNDFEREPLLPHMLSRFGPAQASTDVNGDGFADLYFGGARGQAGALYLQQPNGTFRPVSVEAFEGDAAFEDVAAQFFDADGDNDPDLYVVSGGAWETEHPTEYQDRLYINRGFGRFERSDVLPEMPTSGGVVAAHDFDSDGDLDLFVGGRVIPGRYPEAPRSYLLENVGGGFVDATPETLRRPGMVATAIWADLNESEGAELAIAGEWMPVRIFSMAEGSVEELTAEAGLQRTSGWWNVLRAVDLNGDAALDLVAGNRGLNHWLRADEQDPVSVYAADFGYDATIDPLITYEMNGNTYPVAWRDELLAQIPPLRRKYPDYRSFAEATIDEMLPPGQLRDALRLDAYEFASCVFENKGGGRFAAHRLPLDAQFSPVNDAVSVDVNLDGLMDLVLAGNNFAARAQWGPYSAGRGAVLMNEGMFSFRSLAPVESGLFLPGDVRRLNALETSLGTLIVAGQNDDAIVTFGVNYHEQEPALAIGRTTTDGSVSDK